ncbi:unnamed protein product [Ectocarpus sp. CCAP 1310/34]|nr:unnamed protein product [Ectocarpus sp. CCAP 1310/34]
MDGIFHVNGISGFLAEDPDYEAPDDATPENLHRMVRGDPGGTVLTRRDEAMYYTDFAVFVIVEPSTDKNNNSNSEAAGGSQGHSAGLAQEQVQRELEASGLDLVTFLKSCDDLPNERTPVEGIVSVTADIVCPEPKVRVIEITEGGGNVLFVAANTLYTKNDRFNVRKGEKIKFRAPALTFERDQVAVERCFGLAYLPMLLTAVLNGPTFLSKFSTFVFQKLGTCVQSFQTCDMDLCNLCQKK